MVTNLLLTVIPAEASAQAIMVPTRNTSFDLAITDEVILRVGPSGSSKVGC